jgi:predicted nucleic acid-binding protein
MSFALDTNILARSIQEGHPMQEVADKAVKTLIGRGEDLFLFPQNLYEFWALSRRPVEKNGLGMSAEEALSHLERFERIFSIKADTPAIYLEWRVIIVRDKVTAKLTHDARIVAAMHVHNIRNILTFNKDDFVQFSGIAVFSPSEV